jgi:hypothetical protein
MNGALVSFSSAGDLDNSRGNLLRKSASCMPQTISKVTCYRAEYFRDEEGQDVLLFIDNIFRFTQAGSLPMIMNGALTSFSSAGEPAIDESRGQPKVMCTHNHEWRARELLECRGLR